MYLYDDIDQRIVDARVREFREQTRRYLAGRLSEDDFRALRLRNGLYLQRHAPMLRIAIPYGMLSTRQLRALADIARRYDRGYGHFTTRQNLQLNWVRLEQVPDILAELAAVQLHAIQTSGNCVRNVTVDHLAGVARDEIVDARVWCEIVRQWATLHPEFGFLPRKFKIAVSGSPADRAATFVHDIGLQARRAPCGETGFRVIVGGGLGRLPIVGQVIRDFVPWRDLLGYLEAILRTYNRFGRRDNPHRARLKVLVRDWGIDRFRDAVEAEWAQLRGGPQTLTEDEVRRVASRFTQPVYEPLADLDFAEEPRPFAAWRRRNVHPHKQPGYAAVTLTLKRPGVAPGDVTADEMTAIADLADRYAQGELRVTHEQNLLFADVRQRDLPELWRALRDLGLATPNAGLLTDVIACPGGDYCALANARSIPIAEAIQRRFADLDELLDVGDLDLNISGCMNACGHHHVGHIGILGVDKNGAEFYQLEIGGDQGGERPAALGKVLGPALAGEEVADAVARLVRTYLALRESEAERFVDVVRRAGPEPFRRSVYGDRDQERAHRPRSAAA
ncbi:MAG: nitrite/sulfite reductase [Burkholderiales bacterium]|nr:nitrite/sulfite reductase [Burkholderiales bacterium]